MRSERHFWRWAAVLTLGMLVIAAAQVGLFWLGHADYIRGLAGAGWVTLLNFGAVSFVTLLVVLLLALRYVFARYVQQVHQLAEDVEALTHGNGQGLLDAYEEPPLAELAAAIQELVRRSALTESEVEQRLRLAHADLVEQRDRDARILQSLAVPLLVCNREGRILQYTRPARELPAWRYHVGLGRSCFTLVAPQVVGAALTVLEQRFAGGERNPVWVGPAAEQTPDPALVLRISPLLDPQHHMDGFVVVVQAPADPARQAAAAAAALPRFAPESLQELVQRPLDAVRLVVFDTETTGLAPQDEIVSLAAVPVVQGHILMEETFDRLVDPRRAISAASLAVHGITPEKVRGQPTLAETVPDLAVFAADAVLVAHNAAFDMRFLRKVDAATGLRWTQPVLDTMLLSSLLHPEQPSHALDTLIARYGLTQHPRHTALGDALMTAQLLLYLIPQLRRRGIETVGQALDASRKAPLAWLAK